MDLPIAKYKDELIQAMKEHNLLVIVGETGSGKTTQIPQYLLASQPGCRIVVTQPRRIAAISNATRVSEELNSKVGGKVGYTIRFENVSSSETRLRYMTDGVLLKEILDDPKLEKYDVVIVDEAHERTVGTDILLGLLKRSRNLRSDLKIYIMSATLDVEKFSDFYSECPIFQIPGRLFPVELLHSRHSKLSPQRLIQKSVETALFIHTTEQPGDILVFLPGSQEIERAVREFTTMEESLSYRKDVKYRNEVRGVQVLPIYASLETIDQRAVFREPPSGIRKVVFATNIAQTSITIPGIRYVVDCGFVKQKMYDPKTHMDALLVVPISKAAAIQRAGRAGRTASGKAYRLYSYETFEALDTETTPEIQRTSLIDTVLTLKQLKINDIVHFDFIDPPDSSAIRTALKQLYYLGCIDSQAQITPIGSTMAHLPLSPFLAKALLSASDFGCTEEMTIICAMLSVEMIWIELRRVEYAEDAQRKRKWFCHPTGDHLTMLNVYLLWEKHDFSKEWCRDNFIQYRSLLQARNIISQLHKLLSHLGIRMNSVQSSSSNSFARLSHPDLSPYDPVPILKALCTAFFHQTAKRHRSRNMFYQYTTSVGVPGEAVSSDELLSLFVHPTSVLNLRAMEDVEWVIYHDIIYTTAAHMRCVSKIWDISWVEPYFKRLSEAEKVAQKDSTIGNENDGDSEGDDVKSEPQSELESDRGNITPGATSKDVENDDIKKRERDEAINAARERALKRRKGG
ncbi:P-loop containing nucleoside triphosphate hydrolase protein [Paraphysoderma sedebokerense]|nr:P-loop containing nucleoside triphosphate hydrolase protein [Paraphysoderma sedebokerense]